MHAGPQGEARDWIEAREHLGHAAAVDHLLGSQSKRQGVRGRTDDNIVAVGAIDRQVINRHKSERLTDGEDGLEIYRKLLVTHPRQIILRTSGETRRTYYPADKGLRKYRDVRL